MDKSHFYVMARGSAYETQNHLIYGKGVGYFENLITEELVLKYSNLIHELNKILKSMRG